MGLVGPNRAHRFSDKLQRFISLKNKAKETVFTPRQLETNGIAVRQDGRRRSAFDLLGQADLEMEKVSSFLPAELMSDRAMLDLVRNDALYAQFTDRQQRDTADLRRHENWALPDELDYSDVKGLSRELQIKLSALRPATLAQAAAIEGMTPAALTLLIATLRNAQDAVS